MGQIISAAIQADVCSKIAGQLWRIERLANFSDEMTEGRSNARVEEERVEREGCILNS